MHSSLLIFSLLLFSIPSRTMPILDSHAFISATANEQATWLLGYRGKTTNDARWAPGMEKLLETGLPHIPAHFEAKRLVPQAALDYLSGNPEPVRIESNRFVTLAAVTPSVGWDHGLLWVDTGKPDSAMLFASLQINPAKPSEASLSLFTRRADYLKTMPPQFTATLSTWVARKGVRALSSFTITGEAAEPASLPTSLVGL